MTHVAINTTRLTTAAARVVEGVSPSGEGCVTAKQRAVAVVRRAWWHRVHEVAVASVAKAADACHDVPEPQPRLTHRVAVEVWGGGGGGWRGGGEGGEVGEGKGRHA